MDEWMDGWMDGWMERKHQRDAEDYKKYVKKLSMKRIISHDVTWTKADQVHIHGLVQDCSISSV